MMTRMIKAAVGIWAGLVSLVAFAYLVSPAFAASVPVDLVTKTVAAQPAGFTRSVEFTCPASGTLTDLDTDVGVRVACGDGFRVVSMETEDTTNDTFICGGAGATLANFTTTCLLRRVGAPNGSSFGGELRMTSNGTSNIKCLVNHATNTSTWKVLCAQ